MEEGRSTQAVMEVEFEAGLVVVDSSGSINALDFLKLIEAHVSPETEAQPAGGCQLDRPRNDLGDAVKGGGNEVEGFPLIPPMADSAGRSDLEKIDEIPVSGILWDQVKAWFPVPGGTPIESAQASVGGLRRRVTGICFCADEPAGALEAGQVGHGGQTGWRRLLTQPGLGQGG